MTAPSQAQTLRLNDSIFTIFKIQIFPCADQTSKNSHSQYYELES